MSCRVVEGRFGCVAYYTAGMETFPRLVKNQLVLENNPPVRRQRPGTG